MSMNAVLRAAILVWVLRHSSAQTIFVDSVAKGFTASDLNWVDKGGKFLQSASGKFAAAFINNGDDYYLCITFLDQQVVWTANRNSPIERGDKLQFGSDGNVQLLRGQVPVFSTGTQGSGAQSLQLQDAGNLVVRDSNNKSIWQSFDQPTDTLLVGQTFRSNMRLISAARKAKFKEGRHSLQLDSTSLKLVIDLGGLQRAVPYWIMNNDLRLQGSVSSPAYATIDLKQLSVFSNDSTQQQSLLFTSNGAYSDGNNSLRLLVLGSDGNLQSYVYSGGIQSLDWTLISDACQLPYTCGPYGICYTGQQCRCPSSLRFVNSSDPTRGCSVSQLDLCNNTRQKVTFLELDPNLSYFGNQYTSSVPAASLRECKNLCKQNCSCSSGFYQGSTKSCYLYRTLKLGNFELQSGGYSTFIKMADSGETKQHVLIYAIVGCSLALILAAVGAFGWWYWRRWTASREDEEDGFLESIPGLPTRFTYRQLQVATGGFSKRLGGGGFGSVYEGTLLDRTKVAVKQLESIGQGKKEFRAEVATIGSIHHVNLVRLRGFCSEGNHRLLVYEFLPRGSLDRSLFNEQASLLDWETRYNIALGTVRGLAYLHEDCRERIIHCDIKPENILLDDHFTAKVSDFGLAKLVNKEQSHVFTTMRGTRGYLAPEWLLNTAISEKSDVYSFGMVLLELVSGRKNFDPNETSEKWYIPAYAFKQAEVGKLADLLDKRLVGTADEKQVVNAVRIALWCIQEDVHVRPSTGRVLQMLEGNIMVPDPPLSSQFAVRLHERMVDAVSERDRYSMDKYSDFNSVDLLSVSYLSGPR